MTLLEERNSDTIRGQTLLPDRHCRAALFSLGGIGKTRIALEYALKYKNANDTSVFWIHAATAARAEKSCLEIANLLGIPVWEDPKIDKLQLVKTWLEGKNSGNWVSQTMLCEQCLIR